jgi:hypothetical protein
MNKTNDKIGPPSVPTLGTPVKIGTPSVPRPVPTRLTRTSIQKDFRENQDLYRVPIDTVIRDPHPRKNDELIYDGEIKENVTEYDYLKFVLKKKIEIFNSINTMNKEERKQHLSKFVLYNNFLKNGLLTPPQKEKPILTSSREVIALKQKMKMNIILSIITYDLKEIFILQQKYLKEEKLDNPESFYNNFDLENNWIFFCISVYDEMVKLKKTNPTSVIDTNEILKIIEFVKENKLTYFENFKEVFNKISPRIFKVASAIGTFMGKIATSIKKGFNKYILLKNEIEPKPDCVKILFANFMLILYQYENDIAKFPLKINTTNVGDSTKFQEYFDKVIQQQSKYYDTEFGNSIQIAYLTKEIANEKDENNSTDKLKKLEDQLQQLLEKKMQVAQVGGNRTKMRKPKQKLKNKNKTRRFRK